MRELQSGNLAEERQRSCFRDFDLSELACEGGRTVEDDNPVASGSTDKLRLAGNQTLVPIICQPKLLQLFQGGDKFPKDLKFAD